MVYGNTLSYGFQMVDFFFQSDININANSEEI